MRLLPVLLLLLSLHVQAKKFALVVGGPSKQSDPYLADSIGAVGGATPQEFGYSTARVAYGLQREGYETTVLFDNIGMKTTNAGLEAVRTASAPMFNKLGTMGATAATKENILAALRRIRDNASPGDDFEFNLNAHGYRSCDGDAEGAKSVSDSRDRIANSVQGCQHVIAVTDPATGLAVKIPTAELQGVLREIDAKGIKMNLNLQSCHSGAAQDLFGDFQNTCVGYGASANNYAFMCMPHDSPEDKSYTATLDTVLASHYARYYEEMKEDEFFRNDECMGKIVDNYRRNNVGGSNRYELFMNARKNDLSASEPSLSSQMGNSYFETGLLSPLGMMYASKKPVELCSTDIDNRFQELLALGESGVRAAAEAQVAPDREALRALLDRYNANIRRQRELSPDISDGGGPGSLSSGGLTSLSSSMVLKKRKDAPASAEGPAQPPAEVQASAPLPTSTPEQRRELASLQALAGTMATEIMAKERTIVDSLDRAIVRPGINRNDPCMR